MMWVYSLMPVEESGRHEELDNLKRRLAGRLKVEIIMEYNGF